MTFPPIQAAQSTLVMLPGAPAAHDSGVPSSLFPSLEEMALRASFLQHSGSYILSRGVPPK